MWITNGGFADPHRLAKVTARALHRLIVEPVWRRDERKKRIQDGPARIVDHVRPAAGREGAGGEICSAEIGKGHKVAFNVLNFGRLKRERCAAAAAGRD